MHTENRSCSTFLKTTENWTHWVHKNTLFSYSGKQVGNSGLQGSFGCARHEIKTAGEDALEVGIAVGAAAL